MSPCEMKRVLGLVAGGFLIAATLSVAQNSPTPEARAVAFLSKEVPRWSKENGCYSCHNNGDGARALYVAKRLSHPVTREALADTTAWLLRPNEWDNNKGNPGFSDKKLARIQFAASLLEALDAGEIRDAKLLVEAANALEKEQERDGSWRVDVESAIGSPATYGTYLATYMARRTLEKADAVRFAVQIARADSFLTEAKVETMLAAAAVALGLHDRLDPRAKNSAFEAVILILRSQASDGGWGPYLNAPSEAFDTAIVLLALLEYGDQPGVRARIALGRNYLIQTQLPSGGWPETTRPPGAQSYAEHISTSGWAALALVKTSSAGR